MATTDLGPARLELVESSQVDTLLKKGALVLDSRRTRALFFDGRFLAALDLNRERDYVLARQADLARAAGVGVVQGLMVSQAVDPRSKQVQATKIQIDAGHGVTPSGELVTMNVPVTVDLADVPNLDRLNAAFGLAQMPSDVDASSRSGLYVVALRPVEFTANPIAAYPTTLQGARTSTDGDVIEAVAITLVPFTQSILNISANEARASAAKTIFVDEKMPPMPANALPLAMIMLKGGHLQWVDPFLVRREVGAEHEDLVGLGLSPRAIREAFLLQYDQHLDWVLAQNPGRPIAAADNFHALPPAGRMPANTINADFSQLYFPSQVDVELSIIPEDELPALLEESLLLAPLDLTNANDLASTSVLVLVPKPRSELKVLEGKLTSLTRTLRPVAPGLIARRAPIDALRGLLVGRVFLPPLDPSGGVDGAWRSELQGETELYYIRRRHLNYKASISPIIVEAGRDDVQDENTLTGWLTQSGTSADFTAVRGNATALAQAEMVEWLSAPRFNPATSVTLIGPRPLPPVGIAATTSAATTAATGVSPIARIPIDVPPIRFPPGPLPPVTTTPPNVLAPLLLQAAVFDLKSIKPAEGKIGRADVVGVEARYDDPDLGDGIQRIAQALQPKLPTNDNGATLNKVLAAASQSGRVPELDTIGQKATDAELPAIVDQIVSIANEAAPAVPATDLATFLLTKYRELVS